MRYLRAVSGRFVAIDLGAESGRAMLGELQGDVLSLAEIRRFANEPARDAAGLHWDVLRLWLEITRALGSLDGRIDGIGVDTWGCDFALLGEHGHLLENPFHYRDERTSGVVDRVTQRITHEDLYNRTGTQLLEFNTLFQLFVACERTPKLIDAASALVLMPDLFNYWLTGRLASEYTIASTSQMIDPRRRTWTTSVLSALDLPARLLQPLIEPGTMLGELRSDACAALAGTPVIAPACHDTGSAFAAVGAGARGAVLSSGTWSLLGAEIQTPVSTERARALNFTNEGGVRGTTRLLKNITGLWLLQSCVRAWRAGGRAASYDELLTAASADHLRFRALIDPDHHDFFHPADMPSAIAEFCRRTGQPAPEEPGACTRVILESLAFKYRIVLESLEELTGVHYDTLHIVGGGAKNRLLNQLTADATGRVVLAGPVEATALGNIAMQMVATSAVPSLDEARQLIGRSFPTERYEPSGTSSWDREYSRFLEYVHSRTESASL
jgi:sugar (pentulose or hexulose) kinase